MPTEQRDPLGTLEAAICNAVTGFLGDFGVTRHGTGRLLELANTASPILERGFDLDSESKSEAETEWKSDVVVRGVRVVHVDGGVAVAELDAERVSEGVAIDGKRLSWKDHFSGPVELKHVDGEWRVADLLKNGVSLREASIGPDVAVAESDAVSARVLMGRRERRYTRLYCEVHNLDSAPIKITGCAFGRRRRRFWEWSQRVNVFLREIPPGSTSFAADGDFPNHGLGRDVRLILRTNAGIIDIRPAGTRARKRLPNPHVDLALWSGLALSAIAFIWAGAPIWALGLFAAWVIVMWGAYWRPKAQARMLRR